MQSDGADTEASHRVQIWGFAGSGWDGPDGPDESCYYSSRIWVFVLCGGMPDGLSGELPALLSAAPGVFRTALKAVRGGDEAASSDLSLLERAALLEAEAVQQCGQAELVACRALAVEAGQLGDSFQVWPRGLEWVHTTAQAACYFDRLRAWMAARERLLHGTDCVEAELGATTCSASREFSAPAYARYDHRRFDFRALVLRMLGPHMDLLEPQARSELSADPLAQLHSSSAGRRELGMLSCAREWGAGGLGYSKELDEATRYGCGIFNRAWKSSPLKADFLRLYDEFVAEVVAPLLGSTSEMVFQAVPVFRVFMPHHLGVGPRHTDAAYHAQPNEINFWVPLTEAHTSNSLLVESHPGAADFSPITCGVGSLYHFRGNACEHFTELNVSDSTRELHSVR